MSLIGKGAVVWTADSYKTNAEKEYENYWRGGNAREAIQNSVDAGATTIKIDKVGDSIHILDDGCGMTLDIIQNKLLVIGGSDKSLSDTVATGGLGKAKEALFFSHKKWTIHTNEFTIRGEGPVYEIHEAKKPIKGTKIQISIDGDSWGSVRASFFFVAYHMEVKAKIYIEGNQVRPEHKKGKMVCDLEWGQIFQKKTRQGQKIRTSEMLVRVNGIWMHNSYVPDNCGELVLELKGYSTDVLAASRDSLRYDTKCEVDKFVRGLSVDKQNTLDPLKQPHLELIEGNGEVEVQPEDIDKIVTDLEEENSQITILPPTEDNVLDLVNAARTSAAIDIIKGNQGYTDKRYKVSSILEILGYEPDFVIFRDPSKDKWKGAYIDRFMRSQKGSTLAQIWTETVKQVLFDNQIAIRFTAGFNFDRVSDARYLKQGEKIHFLLNPTTIPATGVQAKVVFMHDMRTRAIHEVTHFFESYHDEDFITKYHALEMNTFKNLRTYMQIGKLRGKKA